MIQNAKSKLAPGSETSKQRRQRLEKIKAEQGKISRISAISGSGAAPDVKLQGGTINARATHGDMAQFEAVLTTDVTSDELVDI